MEGESEEEGGTVVGDNGAINVWGEVEDGDEGFGAGNSELLVVGDCWGFIICGPIVGMVGAVEDGDCGSILGNNGFGSGEGRGEFWWNSGIEAKLEPAIPFSAEFGKTDIGEEMIDCNIWADIVLNVVVLLKVDSWCSALFKNVKAWDELLFSIAFFVKFKFIWISWIKPCRLLVVLFMVSAWNAKAFCWSRVGLDCILIFVKWSVDIDSKLEELPILFDKKIIDITNTKHEIILRLVKFFILI